MIRLVVPVLRVLLGCLFLGGVVGQVWTIPQVATDMEKVNPEVSYLELPYLVLAIATVLCAQVVIVALWALLSRVRRKTVFLAGALPWLDTMIVASILATVLPLAVEVHLLAIVGAGPPTILILLTVTAIASAAFVLLTVLARHVLRVGIGLRDELAAKAALSVAQDVEDSPRMSRTPSR
ncbi:MAG TPA: DUF2975 domain-containing protein [Galbitalea sp.]|nr:DUF2975 domain-containing protein [Galbitalea sp.]